MLYDTAHIRGEGMMVLKILLSIQKEGVFKLVLIVFSHQLSFDIICA